jgi:hypothetical protein
MLMILIQKILSLPVAGVELAMVVIVDAVLCIPRACIFLTILEDDLALACEVMMEMRQIFIHLFVWQIFK